MPIVQKEDAIVIVTKGNLSYAEILRKVKADPDLILGSSNKVWILWIPGHAELEGNEAADELAKKGAGTPLHGPEPFCGIGNGFMTMNLRNEEKLLRELYWAGLPGMEQSRVLIGGFEPMHTKDCLKLSKKNLRIIVGILTGHCLLDYHLGKLGISSDTACRFCEEEEETSIHILGQCSAPVQSRSRNLGSKAERSGSREHTKVPNGYRPA